MTRIIYCGGGSNFFPLHNQFFYNTHYDNKSLSKLYT